MIFRLIILAIISIIVPQAIEAQTNGLVGNLTVQKGLWLQGDISPAEITADQNNFNPTGLATASVLRISSDASHNITGLVPGASPDGRIIVIYSIDNGIVLQNEATASTAANRFHLGADIALTGGGAGVILQYDSVSSRWRVVGGAAAAGGSPGEGTVTSVGITVPAGFTASGSPVTSAGTIAITFATGQTAYRVLATDTSASALALRSLSLAYISDAGTMAAASTSNYYTAAATDTLLGNYVPVTRTVNGSPLSSNVTVTTVTGNAGTATALQTARNINGVAFDGTGDITVTAAAGTLTGATLAANVTASSLTSAAGGAFGTAAYTDATAYQPADSTLDALAAYNSNGLIAQTGADTFAGRTLTGTSDRIAVSNGNGVSGNPTIDIAATYVGQGSITTLGTITAGTWHGSILGGAYGGTGVNNGSSEISIGGDVVFAGAHTTSFTVAADTALILPASGTVIVDTLTSARSLLDRFGTTEGSILFYDGSNWAISIPPGTGRSAFSAVDGDAGWNTVGALLDGLSANQGAIAFRGAPDWTALEAGTAGKVLVTNGTSADPSWESSLSGLTLTSSAFNGTVGATTPSTGAFTTITASTGALINNNSGSAPTPSATNLLQLVAADTDSGNLTLDTFGATPFIYARRANGTNASKTGTVNGSNVLALEGRGYQTTTGAYTGPVARILFQATETHTSTANGGQILLQATPNGSASVATVASISSTGVSVTGALTVSGTTTLNGAVTVNTTGSNSYDLARTGSNPSLDYNVSAGNTFRFLKADASAAPVSMGNLSVTGTISATGDYSIALGKKLLYSSTAFVAPEDNVTGAVLSGTAKSSLAVSGSNIASATSTGLAVTGILTTSGNAKINGTTTSLWSVAPTGENALRLGYNATGTQTFTLFVLGENSSPTAVGSISTNGSVTAYNTTSDKRLKTNIRDLKDADTIIDALKPRVFDWKTGENKDTYGFVAQEVYAVFPQAVLKGDNGAKIVHQWAMDASKMMPVVVSEIQNLRRRLAKLESK